MTLTIHVYLILMLFSRIPNRPFIHILIPQRGARSVLSARPATVFDLNPVYPISASYCKVLSPGVEVVYDESPSSITTVFVKGTSSPLPITKTGSFEIH